MSETKLHKRGVTSFFTLFGFLIMAVTGIVLYIGPAGRVAYWTTWTFVGLSKTDWNNIHILSSLLFIVAGIFHTYFNWGVLMNYFKDRLRRGLRLRKELAITSVVSAVVVISAIWPFPPLSYLLDFNAWTKEIWVVQDDYEPPFGHAELLPLNVFARRMEIDLTDATQELKVNGIVFDSPAETLEAIGRRNGISPMELYLMIKQFEPSPAVTSLASYTPETVDVEFSGTGIGNRSVRGICERLGLDTTLAATRLTSAGLPVELDRTLKSIAADANLEPLDLLKVMLIDGFKPATAAD